MTSKADRRKAKMLAAIETQKQNYIDSLTKDMNIQVSNTKILSNLWKEKLSEYKDTALYYQLMSYQRSLSRQMEFKDKLIEKLQNELDKFNEHRNRSCRDNLELVNDTLCEFKKEIDDVHGQYRVEVEAALPKDLAELEVRINENDDYWKILKYQNTAVQMKTHKTHTDIKNKHLKNMDLEKGRLESIIDKFRWRDMIRFQNMKDDYTSVLEEYKMKTEDMAEEYKNLKEKDENMLVLQKNLNARIKDLLRTINNLEKEMSEPKSVWKLNALIKERDELQEHLKKFLKKIENDSESRFKQQSLLCQITKEIQTVPSSVLCSLRSRAVCSRHRLGEHYSEDGTCNGSETSAQQNRHGCVRTKPHQILKEINNVLKKGNDLMRGIRLCQKLETCEEESNSLPLCNEPDNVQRSDQNSILGNLTQFLCRVSNVKKNSELLDQEIKRLQRDNDGLKMEIQCLVIKNKNQN